MVRRTKVGIGFVKYFQMMCGPIGPVRPGSVVIPPPIRPINAFRPVQFPRYHRKEDLSYITHILQGIAIDEDQIGIFPSSMLPYILSFPDNLAGHQVAVRSMSALGMPAWLYISRSS